MRLTEQLNIIQELYRHAFSKLHDSTEVHLSCMCQLCRTTDLNQLISHEGALCECVGWL